MEVRFAKMTGAGNDFVVIDNRARRIKDGSRAAKLLCDRRWGIGADGLLLLQKSRKARYKLMYYNADGSYGGMCGNGGRCIAWYAVRHGIAAKRHDFEALDYIYGAEVRKREVELAMKDARNLKIGMEIGILGATMSVNFVDTGSPHVVVPVAALKGAISDLSSTDVIRIGRAIRNHDEFAPGGTNVNFIERHGRNSLSIRTYERGVEDETLACGTGSIASAIVASQVWKVRAPVRVIPKSKKTLWVNFRRAGDRFVSVKLRGPAEELFTGVVQLPS